MPTAFHVDFAASIDDFLAEFGKGWTLPDETTFDAILEVDARATGMQDDPYAKTSIETGNLSWKDGAITNPAVGSRITRDDDGESWEVVGKARLVDGWRVCRVRQASRQRMGGV